jgi:hypothetical protein
MASLLVQHKPWWHPSALRLVSTSWILESHVHVWMWHVNPKCKLMHAPRMISSCSLSRFVVSDWEYQLIHKWNTQDFSSLWRCFTFISDQFSTSRAFPDLVDPMAIRSGYIWRGHRKNTIACFWIRVLARQPGKLQLYYFGNGACIFFNNLLPLFSVFMSWF